MSDEEVGVPTNVVDVGLNMDPETALYVGVLEGTIAALVINECKYRAFLELLTDESWEDTKLDIDGNQLMAIAVTALVKQTGMDRVRAQVLVAQRWQKRNLPTETVLPQAVPVEAMTTDQNRPQVASFAKPDMSQRVKAWKERQKADAASIPDDQIG
ncbi:hypothetical protein HWB51_gp033 [Mycobacterium phage Cuke]|uniref:Uncharacterized protein n=1 Tax=Mycobacterium phage Cuke TaxID=2079417 RepID=A0A2L1IWT9_9CAUD|nr:hypothetical protein HWB51_gp033 [Mycobacterium phage Cuke]AVD99651.1 hypothetical protein SEA_CUKE_33 [Mycobacterium phage Cuke]